MPLDPPNTFSSSASFLPLVLLLFLEVGLCGKEDYHIFNKLWVSNNFRCRLFSLNPEQKVLRYSGFPLKQNMHTSRPPCVRKCLQRPEECFRYNLSFWSRGVIARQNGHWWNIFQHGYDNYMQHAWPLDELNPLACCGRGEWPLIHLYFNFNSIFRSGHWKPWQYQHKWCSGRLQPYSYWLPWYLSRYCMSM